MRKQTIKLRSGTNYHVTDVRSTRLLHQGRSYHRGRGAVAPPDSPLAIRGGDIGGAGGAVAPHF